MIDPERTELILGPPGTGKTTHLLGCVERELEDGIDPSRIGYVSFSQRAAFEARDRAARRFSLDSDSMPWFRTIHSLTFRQLGLSPSQVMRPANYQELGRLMNIDLTGQVSWEDGTQTGQSKGDRALHMDGLSRVRCIPLEEQWETDSDRLPYYFVERLSRGLRDYKSSRGLVDFTDMLRRFSRGGPCPQLEVLIVDEAQDLSRLQWSVVERLAANARRVVIAGDDDQAIYAWAGADLGYFMGLRGQERVLDQSYRVPIAVQSLAQTLIDRIKVRRPKAWRARAEQGEVSYLQHPDELDLSSGQWLVLARNRYLLDEITAVCKRHGYFYAVNGSPSVSSTHLSAIVEWERLRAGKPVTAEDVGKFLPFLPSRHLRPGAKKQLGALDPFTPLDLTKLTHDYGLTTADIWHVTLDKIPLLVREYVIAALKRGEKLRSTPRITLSTIHAAKGAEADHVALLTDIAPRTYRDKTKTPEAEARVWYVAATRAKERLVVIRPQTTKHYEL